MKKASQDKKSMQKERCPQTLLAEGLALHEHGKIEKIRNSNSCFLFQYWKVNATPINSKTNF